MKKIKIGVIGPSGRMGQEILKVIEAQANCEVGYSLGRDDKWDNKKAKSVNVWIDFSSPEALAQNLKRAAENKTAFVCGTTGFGKNEKELLEKYAKQMPVLWSSNMSLGVAVLNEALKVFSAIAHFDYQIEEIHHNRKKDRPSGTALTLQENLEKAVGRELPEALAIRGGGVFGVHKIFAMSDEEVITFEHTALNRTVFAKGAVSAAAWLAKQKEPGLYQISDFLFAGKKKK